VTLSNDLVQSSKSHPSGKSGVAAKTSLHSSNDSGFANEPHGHNNNSGNMRRLVSHRPTSPSPPIIIPTDPIRLTANYSVGPPDLLFPVKQETAVCCITYMKFGLSRAGLHYKKKSFNGVRTSSTLFLTKIIMVIFTKSP